VNAPPTGASFCAAAMRDIAGDDDALVRELLDIFVRTVPPMAQRLAHALARGRAAHVAREAHDLKSCLALVGAAEASARCTQIESAARRTGACPPVDEAARLCADIDHIVDLARRHLGCVTDPHETIR
jgi:HPt (histidine-containing phosphotransfer) domain-containing protein